jgi:peptide subunit release factor 1 (eRF1)
VYIARDSSDPGSRGGWKLRFEGSLGAIRAGLEQDAPGDLAAFDEASALVKAALEEFGRVLPHEGWSAFATAEELFHAEGLPFAPPDLVRWRQGIYTAPYVRALKSARPIVVAILDGWHARLLEYLDGRMSPARELSADRWSVDTSDVHGSKRATSTTGMRGETRTEYAQRILDEKSKRLRRQVVDSIVHMIGENGGGVALCGTPKATAAVRKDLEEKLPGRVVEISEPSFDSTEAELAAGAATAASELTRARQARLLEICTQVPDRASVGWKHTYRALAAGAVDTLLVARGLIESNPDDAERLVRLALAQGAEVEELGDEIGARLWPEAEGVAARLRFKLVA